MTAKIHDLAPCLDEAKCIEDICIWGINPILDLCEVLIGEMSDVDPTMIAVSISEHAKSIGRTIYRLNKDAREKEAHGKSNETME